MSASIQKESQHALNLLASLQSKLGRDGDINTEADLANLIDLLHSPVFKQLLAVQDSIEELRDYTVRGGELDCDDFDFSSEGNLVLSAEAEDKFFKTPQPEPAYNQVEPEEDLYSEASSVQQQDLTNIPLPPPIDEYDPDAFEDAINRGSYGREVIFIDLYKAPNTSLGFSVLGLKSEDRGDLGIFVQEISPDGLAAIDGRLRIGDQILAIDRRVLDTNISHPQAIRVLQSAEGTVQLVVARGGEPRPEVQLAREETSAPAPQPASMVLNTEWTQLEVIDLVNDGSGLGFGIIGGKSTGVVVKTLLPGGIADREGRLRIGDHILQIGEVNVRGMASEQVASVLRQLGSYVRLVVARAIQEPPLVQNPTAPIIPTHQLEIHLAHLFGPEHDDDEEHVANHVTQAQVNGSDDHDDMVEYYEAELMKNESGLGITIAGYVGEHENDLSGIFVRSVAEGSPAYYNGKIRVRDHIIAVDHQPLAGHSNAESVEILKRSGDIVNLKFARYIRGPKFEKLQQYATQAEEMNVKEVPARESPFIEPTADVVQSMDEPLQETVQESVQESVQEAVQESVQESVPDEVDEAELLAKWRPIIGDDQDIVVAEIYRECSGLGIGLQGTVDIENGQEVHPHHYIRSFRPDGPVGLNGKLKIGDELLEVNGNILYGLSHVEVVDVLKELPQNVTIVCARYRESEFEGEFDAPLAENPFEEVNLTADLESSNNAEANERMVKAKSEQALHHMPEELSLGQKSQSLEPLSGMAMWHNEVVTIDLEKGDQGLGFCILDYQDPMNPSETVIVVRSLVPGGVAQRDGRLVPGDRLIFVNNENLENATVESAIKALKGAPKGIVEIGVVKPLSFAEDDDDEENSTNPFTDLDLPYDGVGSYPNNYDQRQSSPTSATVFGEVPPLPEALERQVRIRAVRNEDVGLNLEIVDDGINGALVVEVHENSPFYQKVSPGDFIVSIDDNSLRNCSNNAELYSIFSRIGEGDISISYIPEADAAFYRESALIMQREQEPSSFS